MVAYFGQCIHALAELYCQSFARVSKLAFHYGRDLWRSSILL